MIKYRIGYCPPNPGHKARLNCRWYTDVNELLKEYREGDDVYVSYHDKPYIKITIDKILEKFTA